MRFPLFALIAPLVTSVVLWLITGSAYTLLFALLGPVMAVAQYMDGRFHARREAHKQAEREEDEEIAQSQRTQFESLVAREEAVRRNPPSSAYARPENSLRPLWAAGIQPQGDDRSVRLGISRNGGLPVELNVTAGIALRGAAIETRSVMRAIAFQLAWKWGNPEITRVGLTLTSEPELVALLSRSMSVPVTVRHIADEDPIPPGFRFLLKVDRGLATLLDTVDGAAAPIEMSVDLLTRAESNAILPQLCAEAPADIRDVEDIPARVDTVLNTDAEWSSAQESLVVNVGRQSTHPLLLDLVSSGPHAVVTGMTGSGKTEFLKSWLVALAASYSPQELSFLVIDFKGGAGFSQLANLAHIVGIVTDLDHAQAHRAITSLQTEIHYRERVLAQAGVGDIAMLGEGQALGRLIVIVDEYRAVLDAFPELMNTFVDLAARGRSLGIHLILSSQRIGGALGDALLANCALRVGFRVSQKQDSQALLGNDAAFALAHIPGRAVLAGTGLEQREFQAAQLTEQDIEVVEAKTEYWMHLNPEWTPRSPWLPPLATVIPAELMPESIPELSWLGIADIPEHQVQSWVQYSPFTTGNLLITGPTRSGISTACYLIAQQCGGEVITDAEQAWDVVVEGRTDSGILVIDELDALLEEFDLEHREEFLLCLARWARQAPKTSQAVVLGCSAHVRGVAGLLALFPAVLTLTSSSHPGRALWHNHEVQLVLVDAAQSGESLTPRLELREDCSYLIVSHRTREISHRLEAQWGGRLRKITDEISITAQGENAILVGTPEEWMMRSPMLGSHKQESVLVLDGCTSSELRGLRLRAGLFPHTGYGKTLVVEPDGSTTRVIL